MRHVRRNITKMIKVHSYWYQVVFGLSKMIAPAVLMLASLLVSPVTHAQGSSNIPSAPQVSLSTVGGIFCYIYEAFNILFWLLIALTLVMVVVAAYTYLTSGGESEKVSKAGKTLMYAAIAVAVALLAKGIPAIVGDFFGIAGSEITANQCSAV